MKKLFIVFTLLLFTVIGTKQPVEAATYEIDFSFEYLNAYQDYYYTLGTVEYSINDNHITFTLADHPENYIYATGIGDAKINFRDADDLIIDTFVFADCFGSELSTYIDIDLESLGVGDSVKMTVVIPMTSTSAQAPSGYLQSMTLGTTAYAHTDPPNDREIYFKREGSIGTGGDVSDILTTGILPTPPRLNDFTLGLSVLYDMGIDLHVENIHVYQSHLKLYNLDQELLSTRYFYNNEWFLDDYGGETHFFWHLGEQGVYTLNEVAYYEFVVYTDPINTFTDVNNINKFMDFRYSEILKDVYFYVEDTLFYVTYSDVGLPLILPPNIPTTDLEGYSFAYWVDHDGERVTKSDPIHAEMIENDRVSIYAKFLPTPETIDGTTTGTTLDTDNAFYTLVTDLGFSDPASRTVIFVIILIMLTVTLSLMRVPLLAIILSDGAVLIFFSSIGLLPMFATVTIFIILGFVAFNELRSGS